jgi:hypothetical protein
VRTIRRIRIIKHEAVPPRGGSFEVKFFDGRDSKFFYWDDLPSRRLRPDILASEQVLEQATALALAERIALLINQRQTSRKFLQGRAHHDAVLINC